MKRYTKGKYTYKSADQIIANTNNEQLKQKLITRKQERGLMVVVQNGHLQIAIKRLKRKLKNDGRLKEVMQRRQYKKPSVCRKQKKRKMQLKNKYKNNVIQYEQKK